LPVQLCHEEFSPVLKNYVAAALSDDKDLGSLSGRSLCTAKIKKKLKFIDKNNSRSFLFLSRRCQNLN